MIFYSLFSVAIWVKKWLDNLVPKRLADEETICQKAYWQVLPQEKTGTYYYEKSYNNSPCRISAPLLGDICAGKTKKKEPEGSGICSKRA